MNLDLLKVFERIPQITGLPLKMIKGKWYGKCYMDGTPHKDRDDKLMINLYHDTIVFLEQGGDDISIFSWMITYGGCNDISEVYKRLEDDFYSISWRNWKPLEQIVKRDIKYITDKQYNTFCKKTNWSDNLFYKYLCKMFDSESVLSTLAKYKVTCPNYNQVQFWYIDKQGRICKDKIVPYNSDGHRDKSRWMGSHFKAKDDYIGRALFGGHLIEPKRQISCVESEKTALLCSLMYPDKIWVATGGKSNVSLIQQGFDLYPDIDGIDDWSRYGNIIEWWSDWEGYDATSDIGDMIENLKIKQ